MQHQFQVTGMTCGHCERAVVHAVRSIDEEALVKVDLPTGQVTVHVEAITWQPESAGELHR